MITIFPYLIFFAIMFIIASFDILSSRLNNRSKQLLIILSAVLFVLVAGLRWFDVPLTSYNGDYQIFDYSAYENVYDQKIPVGLNFIDNLMSSDIYVKNMDAGYVYISSFFSNYITDDANIFFLIVSMVTVWLFFIGLKRNHITHAIFFVLFIYFCRLYYQYNFIMMRQAIAMAICWWAIPFIIERRFRPFLFATLLGGLFHFTAFLFIIVYWLTYFKFSNKFIIFTMPMLFVLGVLGITDILLIFVMETVLTTAGIGGKVAAYLTSEVYAQGINLFNFLEIAPFLFVGINYRDDICQTSNGKFFFNLLILYTYFMLLTMNFMALTRVSSYYIYSFLFIANYAFTKSEIRGNKVIIGCVLSIYFLVYGIRFINNNFASYGYSVFFLN